MRHWQSTGVKSFRIHTLRSHRYSKSLRSRARIQGPGTSWSRQESGEATSGLGRLIPEVSSGHVPWNKHHPIFIDDLEATLEAHRVRNRATGVRRVVTENGYSAKPGFSTNEHTGIIVTPKLDKVEPWWNASAQSLELDDFSNAQGYTGHNDLSNENREVLEYEGRAQQCQKEWSLSGLPGTRGTCPWLSHLPHFDEDSSYDRLSSEIKAFEFYMKLAPKEEAVRRSVYQDVSNALGRCCQTRMVGPHDTGLTTPTSSLVISAFYRSCSRSNEPAKKHRLTFSQFAQYKLGKLPDTFSPAHSVPACVPTVQVQHKVTGLEIVLQESIKFNMQAELTRLYLQELPTLRSLYIALRYSLEIRDLTNPVIGGLDAYPLLVMIVLALQKRQHNISPMNTKLAWEGGSLLGDQLLDILKFWGRQSTYSEGYTADPFARFPKIVEPNHDQGKFGQSRWMSPPQRMGLDSMQKLDPQRPYLLCLQDPADYTNNLGEHVYKIKHIQATFNSMYEQIKRDIKMAMTSKSCPSQKSSSLLHALLAANYEPCEARRRQLVEYASPPGPQAVDDNQDIEGNPQRKAKNPHGMHPPPGALTES